MLKDIGIHCASSLETGETPRKSGRDSAHIMQTLWRAQRGSAHGAFCTERSGVSLSEIPSLLTRQRHLDLGCFTAPRCGDGDGGRKQPTDAVARLGPVR